MLSQKYLSSIAVVIAIIAIIAYVFFPQESPKLKALIKEQQAEIEKLNEILVLEQEARKIEAAIRSEEKIKEAKAYASLSRLKKADSVAQVRTIKSLISKYKNYTEPALDSMLIKEYEEAIHSNP